MSRIWPTPSGFLVTILEELTFFPGIEEMYPYSPGLYLWREGEFRLLIPGFVSGEAVTGDGCRVAFSHAPSFRALSLEQDWRLGTLKIVDLCDYLDRILVQVPVSNPYARHP